MNKVEYYKRQFNNELKQPILVDIKNLVSDSIKQNLDLLKLTSEDISSLVSLPFEEYSKYTKNKVTSNDVINELRANGLSGQDITKYVNYLMVLLEKLWIMEHAKEFVIDIEKAKKLPKVSEMDIQNIDWDLITNSLITFSKKTNNGKKYIPIHMDYIDTDYTKVSKGEKEKIYRIRYNSGEEEIYNIAFVLSKLPRVFVEQNIEFSEGICSKCKNTHFKTEYTFDTNGVVKKGTVCHLSESRQKECVIFKHPVLSGDVAISVIAYISEMYGKRNSLNRKNSKHIERYKSQGKIDIICKKKEVNQEEKEVYLEVELLSYSKQEKSKNPEYVTRGKHSTHNPPREHYRKAHTRHYKSGKIVEVQGTLVNKGKEKVLYRV